jgi:hypothetical protein
MQELHMSHEEYVDFRRQEALEIARQNPDDAIALLLAVRDLNAILHQVLELEKRVPREDFLFLKGVSSELGGLPVGEERQYWAPKSLAEKDGLSRSYAAVIRAEVIATFGRVVRSLE